MKTTIEREAPSLVQRQLALSLLAALAADGIPDALSINAYDDGLSFHWLDLEVAVYKDRFETYRFLDRDTEIHHWHAVVGKPIDANLIAWLSSNLRPNGS